MHQPIYTQLLLCHDQIYLLWRHAPIMLIYVMKQVIYLPWIYKKHLFNNNNNNNAGVFILRRLHPDDNEQVIANLWTEAQYI